MKVDSKIVVKDLLKATQAVFELAGRKAWAIERTWDTSKGTPVFTVAGKYTTRGWTEWTQGFQYGCQVLLFDATGDRKLLALGRRNTVERMTPHVTHTGVHDHGFNNLSSYGNMRRLMLEGRTPHNAWELEFYNLAIKASGAVQAARWAEVVGASDIFVGVNAVDYSGYPDCRPAFIEAFERLAQLATKAGIEGTRFTIQAPLVKMTKADIIRTGLELGVDYGMTISCYQADSAGRACGKCDSCRLRAAGFAAAGVPDPTQYA